MNQFLLYFLCCNLINGLAGSVIMRSSIVEEKDSWFELT